MTTLAEGRRIWYNVV